jgi:hypothetical protein
MTTIGGRTALALSAVLLVGLTACTSAGDGAAPDSAGTGSATPLQPTASPAPPSGSSATGRGTSPAKLLKSAAQAAAAAQTVRMQMETTSEQGKARYTFDLADGGLVGQADLPEAGKTEIVVVDGSMYLRGSEKLLSRLLSPEIAPQVEGKWLKLPASELANTGISPATNKIQWLALLLTPKEDSRWKTLRTTKDVDSVDSIGLASGTKTVWVAANGDPYPTAVDVTDGSGDGVLFSRWNEAVELQPPPADEVLDLSQQAQPGP